MLNNFLSKYMVKKIIEQKVPGIKNRRCINNLQKRQSCSLCEKHCLQKAISIDNGIRIDAGKCDNCSICASICPTGNIVPTYEVVEKQYSALVQSDNISITCNQSGLNADFYVNCLAVLPWEFIAYVCLENKINLFIKNCAKCEKIELANKINETLIKVRGFLGEELYKERVLLIHKEEELPIKEYSRRDLLKLWGEQSKKIATTVVPIDFEENKNARIYRDLLIKKLQNMNLENSMYNWPSIKIDTDRCWSCKVCEKLCPQKAIYIKDLGDNKGNLIHSHIRCTHCGLCKTVCLSNAIELINLSSSINKKDTENIVELLKCSICNDPIKEDDMGTCIVCKNKSKSRY